MLRSHFAKARAARWRPRALRLSGAYARQTKGADARSARHTRKKRPMSKLVTAIFFDRSRAISKEIRLIALQPTGIVAFVWEGTPKLLYKDLIATYGASLAGRSSLQDDMVWHLVPSDDLTRFRLYALDALMQAKVYLLDHLAANYADTLHDTLQERAEGTGTQAMSYLGDIQFPAEVTWVEFDCRALGIARFERRAPSTLHDDGPRGSGLHGFLIDNRQEDHLRITMFARPEGARVMDPMSFMRLNRTASGQLDYEDVKFEFNQSMIDFRVRTGDSEQKLEARRTIHLINTGSELFIPCALFAMLVSPDLGGIIPSESETFSPKEAKTARKFGKSWILGAQKSHLTIRIGPQAVAHMRERAARQAFERLSQEERNGPVRHWVTEHERHYRSGKVVLIKGHHRGHAPDPGLPTRVMGPRPEVIEFSVPATQPSGSD